MSRLESKQRWGLGIGGILLTLLLAVVFTFGSLDVPFHPKSWREVMVLYAVSSFVTAALLVFLLILGRTTLRLWVERRREQLGAEPQCGAAKNQQEDQKRGGDKAGHR